MNEEKKLSDKVEIVASKPLIRSVLGDIRESLLPQLLEKNQLIIISVGLPPRVYVSTMSDSALKRVHFLDLSGDPSAAKSGLSAVYCRRDINSIMVALNQALMQIISHDRNARCVVFIDDFEMLTFYNTNAGMIRFMKVLTDRLRRAGMGGVFVLTDGLDRDFIEEIYSTVDGIIELS